MTTNITEKLRCATVRVDAIAKFDNWDPRECAVANADEWRELTTSYIAQHCGTVPIPRHIHQIWIGPREPPCVWLDSWRVKFIGKHGTQWRHTLWNDNAVAEMRQQQDMINGDLYDREAMWQCKADLLRLELLYRHGGVYIDADLISLDRPLDDVLEQAQETGFGVSYEADTKDKPYSVMGNSIIFASKGHPLLALLIQYIRKIYDHKRPHFGVEWVSGPLAFSKALLHGNMPFTLIDRVKFYPTFHYIPNPSAINVDDFPNSLGFQFGYTCSNLGEWIRHNNKCLRALDCPYHSKRTDYPLGAIKPFPKNEDKLPQDGRVPKIIHQFCFSSNPPTRWTDTWAKTFCGAHPTWTHRLWTYEDLKRESPYFCSHMYPDESRQMDDETFKMLALEILFKHGGYYVPLTTLFKKSDADLSEELVFPPASKKGLVTAGTILGSIKGGLACLKLIKSFYALGKMPKLLAPAHCDDVVEMDVSDAITCYSSYPQGSRYLGTGRIIFNTTGKYGKAALSRALLFAYDSQVPCFPFGDDSLASLLDNNNSALVWADASVSRYPRVVNEVAGLIYNTEQMDRQWDYLALAIEWNTGCDEVVVRRMHGPSLSETEHCFAVAVNSGRGVKLGFVRGTELVKTVLESHGKERVYAGTVRFAHDEGMSAIYSAMPIVEEVFLRLANHYIPGWDTDAREVHGRLLKGMRSNQVAYELSVDEDRRVMYRAFNDDGGMNSEARISLGLGGHHVVDHVRVYFDHAIVYEGNNVSL